MNLEKIVIVAMTPEGRECIWEFQNTTWVGVEKFINAVKENEKVVRFTITVVIEP